MVRGVNEGLVEAGRGRMGEEGGIFGGEGEWGDGEEKTRCCSKISPFSWSKGSVSLVREEKGLLRKGCKAPDCRVRGGIDGWSSKGIDPDWD